MSGAGERSDAGPGTATRLAGLATAAATRTRLRALLDASAVATIAGAVAVAVVLARTTLRAARNAPVETGAWLRGVDPGPVASVTALVLATACLARAAIVDDDAERVGLACAGAFGLLWTVPSLVAIAGVDPRSRVGVGVPAVVAVAIGAGLVAGGRLVGPGGGHGRTEWVRRDAPAPTAIVAVLLAGGTVVALARAIGLAPVGLRGPATAAFLLGVGLTPGLVPGVSTRHWAAGGLAGAVVLAAGTALPYVSGAVLLVTAGVVATPLPLVALAAGGATVAVLASLERGRLDRAFGVGLVALAGVPTGVPAGLAVVVGLSAALDGGDGHGGDGGGPDHTRDEDHGNDRNGGDHQ